MWASVASSNYDRREIRNLESSSDIYRRNDLIVNELHDYHNIQSKRTTRPLIGPIAANCVRILLSRRLSNMDRNNSESNRHLYEIRLVKYAESPVSRTLNAPSIPAPSSVVLTINCDLKQLEKYMILAHPIAETCSGEVAAIKMFFTLRIPMKFASSDSLTCAVRTAFTTASISCLNYFS